MEHTVDFKCLVSHVDCSMKDSTRFDDKKRMHTEDEARKTGSGPARSSLIVHSSTPDVYCMDRDAKA